MRADTQAPALFGYGGLLAAAAVRCTADCCRCRFATHRVIALRRAHLVIADLQRAGLDPLMDCRPSLDRWGHAYRTGLALGCHLRRDVADYATHPHRPQRAVVLLMLVLRWPRCRWRCSVSREAAAGSASTLRFYDYHPHVGANSGLYRQPQPTSCRHWLAMLLPVVLAFACGRPAGHAATPCRSVGGARPVVAARRGLSFSRVRPGPGWCWPPLHHPRSLYGAGESQRRHGELPAADVLLVARARPLRPMHGTDPLAARWYRIRLD
jgi:hypothetical protein